MQAHALPICTAVTRVLCCRCHAAPPHHQQRFPGCAAEGGRPQLVHSGAPGGQASSQQQAGMHERRRWLATCCRCACCACRCCCLCCSRTCCRCGRPVVSQKPGAGGSGLHQYFNKLQQLALGGGRDTLRLLSGQLDLQTQRRGQALVNGMMRQHAREHALQGLLFCRPEVLP